MLRSAIYITILGWKFAIEHIKILIYITKMKQPVDMGITPGLARPPQSEGLAPSVVFSAYHQGITII